MEIGDLARISVLLAVVVIFTFSILVDVWKAYSRKAHWVPSHYLVLSAFIIQLLSLLCGQSTLSKDALGKAGNVLKHDLWMIHSSRVMLCVVMAYLMPSMAARGSIEFWGKLSALGITIVLQMSSELYRVYLHAKTHNVIWSGRKVTSEHAFVGSAIIITISFVLLLLLLACAHFASLGIQVIFSQKIPLILPSERDADVKQWRWRDVEDKVLKAWIVARAYTPEFIIAKSPLSSSAAVMLWLLIGSSMIGWFMSGPSLKTHGTFNLLKLAVTFLQVAFILIGWVIVTWRSGIAAGYYLKWHSETWRTICKVEDFWTRHIKDLIRAKELKLLPEERLDTEVHKLVVKQTTKNQIPRMFLYLMMMVQWLTVSFSKLCWIISVSFFQSRCMSGLCCILPKQSAKEFEKFSNYEKVLEGLEMLDETRESLWIANKRSIAKAKDLITHGNHDGETSCKELVALLARRKERDGLDLSSFDPKEAAGGFKYLWQMTSIEDCKPLEVEKQFVEATKTSWKMTAVSLISIIIHLSPVCNSSECSDAFGNTSHDFPPKEVKDSLKAYSQAWEILDFVDAHEDNRITCKAADELFITLETSVDKEVLPPRRIFHTTSECSFIAIDELAEQSKRKVYNPRGLDIISAMVNRLGLKSKVEKTKAEGGDLESGGAYDSMDWKEVAGGNAVYKLCKSIARNYNADTRELLEELQLALADIIYASIAKAKLIIVERTSKWAKQSDENSIARALYITGKATALMKEVKRLEKRKTTIPPRYY
ncbi:hypothetical protein SUGI_0873500 [Cryptomeria japonica]|uniref:uncharacterized protein LOC131069306 n=1 Tax=Cryptomeria japonica TaxID=3369 RepID=UPI0024148796|nr:uncharacterized protein LOC131069306 [Cryptomeria japonica]GLJ42187.1 hypothetical protein SUGI_0873500 [Cryptomeria japonica]